MLSLLPLLAQALAKAIALAIKHCCRGCRRLFLLWGWPLPPSHSALVAEPCCSGCFCACSASWAQCQKPRHLHRQPLVLMLLKSRLRRCHRTCPSLRKLPPRLPQPGGVRRGTTNVDGNDAKRNAWLLPSNLR